MDQPVTADRLPVQHNARHGKDGAALLDSEICGDEGATSTARFDDDHTLHQSADDAVARREIAGLWPGTQAIFAEHGPPLNDALHEATVFGRVDHIHAAAQHGNRPATGVKDCPMGHGINASRHPADHSDASAGEFACDVPRGLFAIDSGPAGAHYRHRPFVSRG